MSIREYSYNDNIQLSPHFNVREFKCKCGSNHSILIDTDLIDKLERLYAALNASCGIITSGYRCSTHDRNVGGNGRGQHTKGTACDIIFYDKNNNPISSKIVSCIAQDIGFGGIANITSSYIYTHLDVRTSNIYKGNEVLGTSTVTSDFYRYYNISKTSLYEELNTKFNSNSIKTSSISDKAYLTNTSAKPLVWDYNNDEQIAELQIILNSRGAKLDVDSKAGDKTYQALQNYCICKGCKGDLVKWVQQRLNIMGYDCGVADGIVGNNTMKGIEAFQKAYSLPIGYLDGMDWYYIIC